MVAKLYEVRPFQCRLAEKDAIVGHNPDPVPVQSGEPADQGLSILRLELMEPGAVHHPADDLAYVVRPANVRGYDVVQFRRVFGRVFGVGPVIVVRR